jgi:hypothetical protein
MLGSNPASHAEQQALQSHHCAACFLNNPSRKRQQALLFMSTY